MSNTIKLKRGSGSNPSASDLSIGEVALRTDTGQLFTKKDNNAVQEIGAESGVSDGDKGDITVSNSGTVFSIDSGVIDNANIASNAAIAGSKIDPNFGSASVNTGHLIAAIDGNTSISLQDTGHGFPSSEMKLTNGGRDLSIIAPVDIRLLPQGGEKGVEIIGNGAVTLHFNDNPKIATTNTGVDVTGNIVVSGTVDGRDLATDGSKLDGIESGATADQSASEILTLIKTVDGAGSGLDADTLDGVSSASFLRSDADDSFSGTITANSDGTNPIIKVQGAGPNFIQFASDASGTVDADSINFVYRSSPNTLGFERASDATILFTVDADNGQANFPFNLDVGSGLDVTGNISVTGTVDGVNIAERNTLFGGLTSSSGVLTNGVTATTQAAGNNTTRVATTAFVSTAIANLIDSSPSTLNTLNELAAALGDDPNFSTTVTNSIATKLPLAGGTMSGDINLANNVLYFSDVSSTNRDHIWSDDNDNSFNFCHDTTRKGTANSNLKAASFIGSGASLTNLNASNLSSGTIPAARLSAADLLTKIKTVDGNGSGLDADTLDGIGSGNFLRSDVDDVATKRIRFENNVTDNEDDMATSTANLGCIEIKNTGAGNDAFMAFHAGNDFAFYFGLNADINDLAVGGWSFGANKYRIWHAGNMGSGSLLDSDKLDGQEGSYYRNASNINSGTLNTARLPLTYTKAGKITIQATGLTNDVHLDAADNIILESGEEESGAIYFRGNNGATSYRFSKGGQTTHEGFLSFESITADRTFTFPNTTGTIALTSSNITGTSGGFTAGNASNLNSGTIPSARISGLGDASANKITLANLEKSNFNGDGQLGFDSSQGLLIYRTQQGTTGSVTVLDGANVDAGTGISITNLGTGNTDTTSFTFSLANHSAALLTSGTLDAARLPNHSAALLTSGTIPDARISGNFLKTNENDSILATLTIGDGSGQHELHLKKADNNTSDHLQFYNGTTRTGEIGSQDNTWLRINQVTNKNIYTPRYIRADNGFFVDGTSKGINGSGNFIGGTIAGASDYSTLLRSDTADTASGAITFSSGAGAVSIAANSDIRFTTGTWTGNTCKIQHHNNRLYIVGGSSGIRFREAGADRWDINGSGHFVPTSDSTYNIGSNGTRVANGYFDTLYGDGSNLTGISAGAQGGASDEVFWCNGQSVTSNFTIPNNKNAMSAGPIEIESGVTVTIGSGENWTVV